LPKGDALLTPRRRLASRFIAPHPHGFSFLQI